MARNSVLQSGFDITLKKRWVGERFYERGEKGNGNGKGKGKCQDEGEGLLPGTIELLHEPK